MVLPISQPFAPMEALSIAELPRGGGWQYEPKWDGFRCIVIRDGDDIALQSKAGQPLARYFPEVVDHVRSIDARRFVLDGELVVSVRGTPSFGALQQRIHPAASRIARLARETPAQLMLFDLLVDERGRSLIDLPLAERRRRLALFTSRHLGGEADVLLSPATTDRDIAQGWMDDLGGALDGVVAKRLDEPYQPGERALRKIKRVRTADCVVGGFRYGANGKGTAKLVGSLLLGLYGDDGLLHHIGHTSSMPAADRPALTRRLEAIRGEPGFTGRAPGGPSRWARDRDSSWIPVKPTLVVEVSFDHASEGRLRHGSRFVRFRPDKAPTQCTMLQLGQVVGA
ncbi:MAG TPA: ATP-dependent DNA ligase [Planctomycetota bacterium]|nr:ATP-dependent DNA ligase [Planctomycetota bacterium]